MTKQESFKRRIRRRMEKTGERYGAARRVLIEQASAGRSRSWVAEPELSDDAVQAATGRTWEEWCDVLDAWPGRGQGHTAMAAHVRDEHGIDGWWAQTVTVGYERITGLRLRYQRADGSFTASRSRTVTVDAGALRELLLDASSRADVFPGNETELRSRPTSKVVRLAIGPGTAQIAVDPVGSGRARVAVAHERLPSLGGAIREHALMQPVTATTTWVQNLGILRDAPSQAIRERIIEGRTRHLQHEINTFDDQIRKILGGGS